MNVYGNISFLETEHSIGLSSVNSVWYIKILPQEDVHKLGKHGNDPRYPKCKTIENLISPTREVSEQSPRSLSQFLHLSLKPIVN
jgi:hypothetical protein